jgi:RNA recognition motif-containing protein
MPEKVDSPMEAELYVGNLSKSTTQEQLSLLFAEAGEVIAVNLIRNRRNGESNGFAFVRMSAQSEADKAVSMFNAYALDDHYLRVNLVRPRRARGLDRTY